MKAETLQAEYGRAMVRDLPRHQIPRNAVWGLVDYLPNRDGGALTKRGGWSWASPLLTGATKVDTVAWAPFAAGAQLVAVDDTDDLWKVDTSVSATNKGALGITAGRPHFFQNLLIVPDAAGAAAPRKYDGSAAPATLGGSPPNVRFLTSHKSRLVGTGAAADPRAVYFSDPIDPETWDTTNSLLRVTNPAAAIASLRNVILVWSASGTERIRGDSPPPGGDMIREPIFDEGCLDHRSVVIVGDRAIFANARGVWLTDGATVDNYADLGGIGQYWRNMLEGWDPNWALAAGLLQGYYVITVRNGDAVVDTLALDVSKKTWVRVSNLNAAEFAEAYGTAAETYFASRSTNRVGSLSSIFDEGLEDADGTDIQPVLETMFYRGEAMSRRWKSLIVGHVLESSDPNAYLEVSVATTPEDDTYSVVTFDDGTTPRKLAVNTAYERERLPLRLAAEGIALKVRQVGPSTRTMLFDLQAEVHEREGMR